MKRIAAGIMLSLALVTGAGAGVAQAGPIGSGDRGSDGSSLDRYRHSFGMDNRTGDAGHDIMREMKLRDLGWHGNNN